MKIIHIILFSTLYLLGLDTHLICIQDNNQSVQNSCNSILFDKNITITILPMKKGNTSIKENIHSIQQTIQKITQKSKKYYPYIIVYAKGFNASLLSVAYHNLSRDYQKSVTSLMLEDVPIYLYKHCFKKGATIPKPNYCQNIKNYADSFSYKQSLYELSNALDISIQQDWFFPNTLYLDTHKKSLDKIQSIHHMADALSLSYQYIYASTHTSKQLAIDNYLSAILSQEKSHKRVKKTKLNNHFPILRFHLGKIIYYNRVPLITLYDKKYGSNDQHTFDIFYKKDSKKNPIIIYIHGGGWFGGDKVQFQDYMKYYADMGFTAATINYRLLHLPNTTMKMLIKDTRKAIEHIITHAKQYHGNPQKVILMGESSGAQLLFMASITLDSTFKKDIQGIIINSMCSNFSLYSIQKQKKLSGYTDFSQRKKWIQSMSPVEHLDKLSLPILALHSYNDTIVIPKNLESLDLSSIFTKNHLNMLWISHASHPIASTGDMIPSYKTIEKKIFQFILKWTKKKE